MISNKSKISYEPEADVLRIEISDQPIDSAEEMGNIVVHFSPNGLPAYLEVLNYSFVKDHKVYYTRYGNKYYLKEND